MFNRSLLFWKLSSVFIAIILGLVGGMGYVNNRVDERYAISSARDVCWFRAETILRSLKTLMMSRDNAAIDELMENLPESTPGYNDICLVSHGGRVAASRLGYAGEIMDPSSGGCRFCHDLKDPLQGTTVRSHDTIVELPSGKRAVSMVVPILNEPSCSTADCHAHEQSGTVLGFLQTEFSLAKADALIEERRLQGLFTVVVGILLSMVATWFMMNRLVERPIRTLITGMKRLAANDFSFRFGFRRKDEIGLLAESFDDMTAKLTSSLSELKETKDYLEGIVENSADIIITVNPAKLIQTFNAGAERALGYAREEVVGKRIEMLFADPREREAAIVRLTDTDNVVNYETRFVTKAGEVRNVIVTLSRLRDADGKAIGTLGISKDVTNEKRLQRQLIQSERLAAVGQALLGIQHSMKNMVNALQGGSYLVRTGLTKDDQEMAKEGWRMVQEQIAAITALSSNMLNYVRDWNPDFQVADLADVVNQICRVVGQTAKDKGVSVRLDLPGPLPLVHCDPKLMHTAVMDLATNALDACLAKEYEEGETPEVVVGAYVVGVGNKVAVEVRDNGCGMDEDVKSSIFAPFFSTKKQAGTGLGLALVSRIVSVHGGTIRVESKAGWGSVFRILVPAHRIQQEQGGS